MLFTLLLVGVQLTVPEIIRQVIDRGLAMGDVHYLALLSLLLVGIGLLRASFIYAQRYTNEWIANHIGYDLRNRLYDHIQHLSFSFHDHTQTGQLISRCIEDVRAVERFTGFGVVELIRLTVLLVSILSLLFLSQLDLALVSLLPIIPLILITTNFGRKVGAYFFKVEVALGNLSAHLQENVSGAQVVRAFAREPYETERFLKRSRELYNARVAVLTMFSRVMPTTQLLVSLSTILILWYGGNLVLQGEMTIGEVVAFNSYLLMLAGPAQQLTWLVNSAGEAVAGLRRSFEILDLKPEIQNLPTAVSVENMQGKVQFQNIYFRYTDQVTPALEEINVSVEPNQIVALIGPTGSGKSSFINLIPRFYDPSQGNVLIDGHNVRDLDLITLRKQIGIVLQTSLLFSASLAENIAYSRPDATQDEIEAAARAAQAHDFIMELPAGYQTVVGERGVTLSGGQRQRVAIARALLMNPRILILDDSTSSVDTETERSIQQALDRMMQGRTTFVIAHRLSTVRRADLILVMNDGKIVERGKHEELLANSGLYREIYELQLREHIKDDGQPDLELQSAREFHLIQQREEGM